MAFDPTKDYITREEKYLTKMAGNDDVTVPDPITRFEQYLKAICDNISSGGGGGGGASALLVTETITEDGGDVTITWDKTAGEVIDAMPFVYCVCTNEYGAVMYIPIGAQYDSNGGGVSPQFADHIVPAYYYAEGYGYAFTPFNFVNSNAMLTAATRSDYPTWTGSR